jgi:cytochrome c oxidase subunit 2
MRTRFLAILASVVSFVITGGIRGADAPSARRTVEITAHRFEFLPHEIHLKKGETVLLRVTSEDVKHGFFSRELGLDADLTPGKPEELRLTADKRGRFLIICDHFCGAQHGNMKMTVVVED